MTNNGQQLATNMEKGIMLAEMSIADTPAMLAKLNTTINRRPVYLSGPNPGWLIPLLNSGVNIALNLNWASTSIPVEFPNADDIYKNALIKVFEIYKPYLAQIPFVVCENEEDNVVYHIGGAAKYLPLLQMFTEVAHSYGFKVANAGFTVRIAYWMPDYYNKTGHPDRAQKWRDTVMKGIPPGSIDQTLVQSIWDFLNGYKTIPFDYINFHLYWPLRANLGDIPFVDDTISRIVAAVKKTSGKRLAISNEMGQYFINSTTLSSMLDDSVGYLDYNTWYSGTESSPAVPLYDSGLELYSNGIAFRDF